MNAFGNHIISAPKIRHLINMGCLFDVPTGHYVLGADGESILCGGLAPCTGVGGRGNTYKSTLAHYFFLRGLERTIGCGGTGIVYDTEPPSVSNTRFMKLANQMPGIAGVDLEDKGAVMYTDSTVMLGNEWFSGIKGYAAEKVHKDNLKRNTRTLPFIGTDGKNFTCLVPTFSEVDSFSMMPVESVEKIYATNEIGESGMNIEAMRAAAAKNQMLMQVPNLTGGHGIFMILTAHAGDEIKMDQYAPSTKKLGFLRGGLKFKQVPEKFTFLTNNLWLTLSASPFLNKTTKASEFPRDASDTMEGNTDLQIVQLLNIRAKTGPTGMPFELLVSQSEGLLVGLSEFWYIKNDGGYGLGGHDRGYFLELLPDVGMQRTTVRRTINSNEQLRRALEITSEMCQMKNLWHDLDPTLVCTPKQLRDDLIALGYDWDVLFATRGYWCFLEDKNPIPFLSTMDLMRMRVGLYHPKWYTKPLTPKAALEKDKV